MAIFVTGDTHGAQWQGMNSVDGFMNRLSTDSFPEQKGMNKDDYVIICGDFGGIWATDQENASETEEEKYSLDWLDKKSFTTLFIPGNHENYDRLMGITDKRLLNCWLYRRLTEKGLDRLTNVYPQADWHGGKIRYIRGSVMMLDRLELSTKNNWLDEQNRVFIYYTVDEIIEKMGCLTRKQQGKSPFYNALVLLFLVC